MAAASGTPATIAIVEDVLIFVTVLASIAITPIELGVMAPPFPPIDWSL
jgi:hypothetical protein